MHRIFMLVLFGLTTPAFALNSRSAVSINGLDSNACTTAAPCRSFSTAIAQTSSGGEVVALDTAGYGPFTVTTTMTISGAPGAHAAITVSSGNGITVNVTGADIVTLRNLVLIGSGGGTSGVFVLLAQETRVLNCFIRGFASGLEVRSGLMSVDHTVIADATTGVSVFGSPNSVAALISNAYVDNCNIGVQVVSLASAMIRNCVIADGVVGVSVASNAGTGSLAASAVIESSTIAYNSIGVDASASGGNNTATVFLAENNIAYSDNGVTKSGAATINSYGNNRFPKVTTVGPLTLIGMQ